MSSWDDMMRRAGEDDPATIREMQGIEGASLHDWRKLVDVTVSHVVRFTKRLRVRKLPRVANSKYRKEVP